MEEQVSINVLTRPIFVCWQAPDVYIVTIWQYVTPVNKKKIEVLILFEELLGFSTSCSLGLEYRYENWV